MPSVIARPSLSRSSDSSKAITSKGPVTASTETTLASGTFIAFTPSPTELAFPTADSINTYARIVVLASLTVLGSRVPHHTALLRRVKRQTGGISAPLFVAHERRRGL